MLQLFYFFHLIFYLVSRPIEFQFNLLSLLFLFQTLALDFLQSFLEDLLSILKGFLELLKLSSPLFCLIFKLFIFPNLQLKGDIMLVAFHGYLLAKLS
jgi:hypothetical protein